MKFYLKDNSASSRRPFESSQKGVSLAKRNMVIRAMTGTRALILAMTLQLSVTKPSAYTNSIPEEKYREGQVTNMQRILLVAISAM